MPWYMHGVPPSTTNIIPVMTSYTAPAGVVSAKSEFSNYLAWKAVDGVNDTIGWATSQAVNPMPQWWQYQLATPAIVTAYAITSRNEPSPRYPHAWQFQASNNGTDWTTLDTQPGIGAWGGPNVRKEFQIDNYTAYSYYRLNITQSWDGLYVGLGVVEFLTM